MELITKFFALFFRALVPAENASAKELYDYRLLLTGGFAVMTIASAFHVALVCGYLTSLFPGFAKADDVQALQKQQVVIIAQALDNDIFRTREAQCRSLSGDAKILYTQRLQDKLEQWRSLLGRPYRIPGCDEYGPMPPASSP